MQTAILSLIAIIFILLVLILYHFANRSARNKRKGKGRNYRPPVEAEQAEWRDKEIARRIALEQSDALERVNLRNETLAYYEAVKQRHEKIEAVKRLGLPIKEDEIDAMSQLSLDEYLNLR